MKVCVLGANGNVGRRVVAAGLVQGHTVTAALRDPSRLPPDFHGKVEARTVDYLSRSSIEAAMSGHDVVVNAAGYVADKDFVALVGRIIEAAESSLGKGGRFWMLAGAALLDVPGTNTMTLDYPKIPPVYQPHRRNYEAVRKTSLDWSVLCPGPLIDAPDGRPTPRIVISTEQWPVERWPLAAHLPGIATSLNFLKIVPRMTVFYEDAAKVIVDNLSYGGPFSRRRVGLALPAGQRNYKAQYRADVAKAG